MRIHPESYRDLSSHNEGKRTRKDCDTAVSPVVGVMLMLVVVIIIAAVVSGFAGNLIGGNNQKVPSLAMDLDIANSGHWSNSYFKGEVTSTSGPIDTHNLKIVTSWKKMLPNGSTLQGGATTSPGVVNTNVIYDTHGGAGYDLWRLTVPYGYGSGALNGTAPGGNIFWTIDSGGSEYAVISGQSGNYSWWGNYKLQAGTAFLARPFGGRVSSQAYLGAPGSKPNEFTSGYGVKTRFQYNYSSPSEYVPGSCKLTMEGGTTSCSSNGWLFPYPYGMTDPMPTTYVPYLPLPANWDPRTYSIDQIQGVLGPNWEFLRPGDIVNVKFIHIPSGKTIWEKNVVVSGTTS
jgi:hypothetical protein